MQYKTDLEIAQAAKVTNISEIAKAIGITESELAPHGYDKAKVSLSILERLSSKKNGKLITPAASKRPNAPAFILAFGFA